MDANGIFQQVYDPATKALRTEGAGGGGTTVVSGTVAPAQGTLADHSSTITVGGTAQTGVAANAARKYLLIVNPITATEPLWFNLTTTATTDSPSIGLNPGDSYVEEAGFVSTEAVSVVAATTAHKFTLKDG